MEAFIINHGLDLYSATFLTVVFINMLPAFAPPTWLVLAYLTAKYPDTNPWIIIGIGMIAAAVGRAILYSYSKILGLKITFIKKRKEHTKILKELANKNPIKVFIASFLYSLSPIPSNIVFIFSGLIEINLIPILMGFLLGRFISYSLGVFTYNKVLEITHIARNSVLIDVFTLIIAFGLVFIDWEKIIDSTKKYLK